MGTFLTYKVYKGSPNSGFTRPSDSILERGRATRSANGVGPNEPADIYV